MAFQAPLPLAGMAELRQFILVRIVPRAGGKTDKLPCDWRTGEVVSAHDANQWTSYSEAASAAAARGAGWGVGFVFTAGCGYWFLDIDNAAQGGQWSPLAQQLCAAFPGAAIELSNSGTGLHIFGRGAIPPHGCKNIKLGLELYHEGRFVLLGSQQVGDCRTDHTAMLAAVVATYFPPGVTSASVDDLSDEPVPEWSGPTDDDALLQRMLASHSKLGAFTGRATFADLWQGNTEALARSYPDTGRQQRAYDASSADAALMQHLAYWTGKHGTRMLALAQRSALVREKWQREDYLQRTAKRAIASCTQVYHADTTPPQASEPAEFTGGFVASHQLPELFKGCVYVIKAHAAIIPGNTSPIKPDRFDVLYGGYSFGLDQTNERTTKRAWEAWTLNQVARPAQAMEMCFRPTEAPGAIIDEAGITMVNVWVPAKIDRTAGDVTPLLDHLQRLLPDPHDREVMLSYMAAIVQHQGVKFAWAPLLQGVEGNGKSFLTWCVQAAVGPQYTYIPRADQISNKFNSWLFGKVFVGVEDVFVAHDRLELFEVLKPMITATRQSVELKGVDAAMADVVANFIFNSNHQDGLRKTRNDRRIAPLFCAQQEKDHLQRDGLTGPYFRKLYAWWRGTGRAAINDFLHTYRIPPGYNPALDCERAPATSSTESAVAASLGATEQHILEAIEQGRLGFKGGWVSSTYLGQLLQELRVDSRIPPNKRRGLMQAIGYDWHPALQSGRVDNMVLPDATKPVLYIKHGHQDLLLTKRSDVGRRYAEAQK